MPNLPGDLKQKSKTNSDGLSAPGSDKLAETTANKETVRERLTREIAQIQGSRKPSQLGKGS
jgi:hypothetical protein